MSYQRKSETPKSFDEWYEVQIERLLQRTKTEYIRHVVYCYSCKQVSQNPHGHESAPAQCPKCKRAFNEENRCALPDFVMTMGDKKGIVLIHGSIHFKDEKRRRKDYEQYLEFLANGYKVFVILNETIERAGTSVLNAILGGWKEAMLDDQKYVELYANEKELGYLQRAVVERYGAVTA